MTTMNVKPEIVSVKDLTGLHIEEIRRIIDEKKAEYIAAIQVLNSRRNELAPVSCLPPEVMGKIFSFSIAEHVGDDYTRYASWSFDFSMWFNFSYVCQTWRSIALNTPTLWTTPAFHYPKWTAAMLERSKMADLVIDSDIVGPDIPLIKNVFSNHVSRIREVRLNGLTAPILSSILEDVKPSSLRLRFLHLSSDISNWPPLPIHVMVQTEALEHLTIKSCRFSWFSYPCPRLTNLTIHQAVERPSMSEFIAALCGMPALESLDLRESLPLASSVVRSSKITLAKLQNLRLMSIDNVHEVLNVLSLLLVPCTTRVAIIYEEATARTQDLPPGLATSLADFLSGMKTEGDKFSFDRLQLFSTPGLVLDAWRRKQQSYSIQPDFDLTVPYFLVSSSKILAAIFPSLPLRNLTTLVIEVVLDSNTLVRTFGNLPALQSVELTTTECASEFIEALMHKPAEYDKLETAYYSVSFPRLQSLCFRAFMVHLELEVLQDCFIERSERGAALLELQIRNCWIDEHDVQLLKEIVVEVDWDGVMEEFSDVSEW